MDTKKLEVIIDAVRLGSFSKAAEKHGYTAPAVIYIFDGIESELGVKLVHRDSFGIRPTEHGEILFPRLTELCKLAEEIKKEALGLSKEKSKITIGCYSSVAKSFLVNKLMKIQQRLSDTEVSIVIKNSISEMKELGADIFLVNKSECKDREYTRLYTADYVAIVNSMWFDGKESLTAEDLCTHPFIMPRDTAVSKAFSSLACEIIQVNAADDSAIIEMVKKGIGCAVLTSRSVSENETGIKMLPISPKIKNEIVLTYDKKTKNTERVARAILNS